MVNFYIRSNRQLRRSGSNQNVMLPRPPKQVGLDATVWLQVSLNLFRNIREDCSQTIEPTRFGRCNRSQFELGETAVGVPHLRMQNGGLAARLTASRLVRKGWIGFRELS